MTMHKFDGDSWKFKALEDYVTYREISGLVANDAAVRAYIDSHRINTSDITAFSQENLNSLRGGIVSTLEESLAHFACQTIVSLCTAFEVATRDFFRSFFAVNPAALYEYIGPDDAKGQVPLRDILHVKSHDELILRLADRAAGVASKGKYGQIYGRALALCGESEDKELTQRLNTLQALRNRLVHERYRPDFGLEDVKDAHSVIDATIEALCELGASKEIPGSYTCVRPTVIFEITDFATLVTNDSAEEHASSCADTEGGT